MMSNRRLALLALCFILFCTHHLARSRDFVANALSDTQYVAATRQGRLKATTLCALFAENETGRCVSAGLRQMFEPHGLPVPRPFSSSQTRSVEKDDVGSFIFNVSNVRGRSCVAMEERDAPLLAAFRCCDGHPECALDVLRRAIKSSERTVDGSLVPAVNIDTVANRRLRRVALFEASTSHSELIGSFAEMFRGWHVDAYVSSASHHSFLRMFEHKINKTYAPEDLTAERGANEYDVIVLLTGSQWWDLHPSRRAAWSAKAILVVHYVWEMVELRNCGRARVPLLPMLRSISKVDPVLPVFVPFGLDRFRTRSMDAMFRRELIVILGMRAETIGVRDDPNRKTYVTKDTDDLVRFVDAVESLSSSRLRVVLVAEETSSLREALSSLHERRRFEWLTDCDVVCLDDLLREHVRYVHVLSSATSSYQRWRMTAAVPLALSFGIPMILDRRLSDAYGVTSASLTYDSSTTSSAAVVPLIAADSASPSSSARRLFASYESRRAAAFGLRNMIMRRNRQRFWRAY